MYVRVFHDLWESSLMGEAVPVRWLFVTMLGMADKARSGIIDVPLFILARQAGMGEEETRAALSVLMAPDPNSRSEKLDGRRVVPLRPDQDERGWEIVNWDDYASQIKAADRRKQIREAVKRHREKHSTGQKPRKAQASTGSSTGQPPANVDAVNDVTTEVSAVSKPNQNVNKKHEGKEGKFFSPPTLLESTVIPSPIGATGGFSLDSRRGNGKDRDPFDPKDPAPERIQLLHRRCLEGQKLDPAEVDELYGWIRGKATTP